MISESRYWKRPLLAMAKRLRQLRQPGFWSDRQLVQIEKDVFIGFYSIRKLFEAPTKITDATKRVSVSLTWHANRGTPVPWQTSDRIHDYYELEAAKDEVRPIVYVANLIIHSFIFMPALNDKGGLKNIFFTSDRDKDSKLYLIQTDELVRVFELVGNDSPRQVRVHKDSVTGKESVTVT
jgi:hypothetical protein